MVYFTQSGTECFSVTYPLLISTGFNPTDANIANNKYGDKSHSEVFLYIKANDIQDIQDTEYVHDMHHIHDMHNVHDIKMYTISKCTRYTRYTRRHFLYQNSTVYVHSIFINFQKQIFTKVKASEIEKEKKTN